MKIGLSSYPPRTLLTAPFRPAPFWIAPPRPAPRHTHALPPRPATQCNKRATFPASSTKANIGKKGEKYVSPQHSKQAAREMTDKSTLNRISDDIATISVAAMVVAADKASDIAKSQEPWLCACRCLDCAHPRFQISNNQTTGYRLVWCYAWSNFTILLKRKHHALKVSVYKINGEIIPMTRHTGKANWAESFTPSHEEPRHKQMRIVVVNERG